jgi:type I restriction enzyme R subunit
VADATEFSVRNGVRLTEIEGAPTANFKRAQAIKDAADRLLAPEVVRRDFLAHESLVNSLYTAVKPDPVAIEFAGRCACLRAIAAEVRNTSDPPDISHVMQGIQALLDESIGSQPFRIEVAEPNSPHYKGIDLSKIDFEVLRKRFDKKRPKNTDLERLKAAVRAQLERMVRLNRTRADYLEKFQALI